MKTRVMITGTGPLGVGEGLVRCLKLVSDQYEIWAGNMDESAASLYECDYGIVLPKASDPGYLESVCKAVDHSRAEFLIPGSEPELVALSQHRDEFEKRNCHLLANPPSVVEIGDDKFKTFEFLTKAGIRTPLTTLDITLENAKSMGFPVVYKARSGGGGKNVFILRSEEDFTNAQQQMETKGIAMMLQEYIGDADSEFTASALTDLKGNLIGTFAARRTLLGGATSTVHIEDFPVIRKMALDVAQAIGALGSINIQCRLTPSGPSLFEINPRFSGSAPFRALAGFNEAHLLISSILNGSPVEVPPISYGTFGIRSFSESLFPITDKDRLMRFSTP